MNPTTKATIEDNREKVRSIIVFIIKPELKNALNFKKIIKCTIIADKVTDEMKIVGLGKDRDSDTYKSSEAPNVIKLSENPSYEHGFIELFVSQIKNFKHLLSANLQFQYTEETEKETGKLIKKHLNNCIKYINTEGQEDEQNFRTDF
jgi:hypothetical protein